MLGFNLKNEENESKELALTEEVTALAEKPVKSVVQVEFENGKSYPYYNEAFALKKGDLVYVDGKLAGKIGVVTDVTTKFKVSLDFYKLVLRKLDTEFHGEFTKFGDFMVCENSCNITEKRADSWFKAPRETEEVFVTGEGYEATIFDGTVDTPVDGETYKQAIDLLYREKLKFIETKNGKGYAYIKHHDGYTKVNFSVYAEKIYDLYCECLNQNFCMDLEAVCIVLAFLNAKGVDLRNFTAMHEGMFNFLVREKEIKITV